MHNGALRPYLFAKGHGIHSRFTSIEQMQSCLIHRNIIPALAAFQIEESASLYLRQGAPNTEYDLHRLYIERMLRAVPRKSSPYPLVAALAREYEIRNVALFLKHGANTRASYWYTLPNEGETLFGHETFALARDTITEMLEKSRFAPIVRQWNETRDTVLLDAALERFYCQAVERGIDTIPGKDRAAVRTLYEQRLSLRMTVGALRMQCTYGIDKKDIPALLYLPTQALQHEVSEVMERARFTNIIDALPRWAQSRARDIVAKRPDLRSDNSDPELSTADLAHLEKIAASIMLRLYRHAFHRYGNGYAPLYCFYHLLKRELQNIMLLVNGIRFGVDPDTFKSELVY